MYIDMITFKDKPDREEEVKRILNETVEKWFFSRFKEFSLPQLYAVREIHSRQNVLVSAPTGGTKTLTAFLSVLNELVDLSEKEILEDRVYCVYVSPLKALNNDIFKNLIEPLDEIERISEKKLGIRVNVRTGDTTQQEKQKMLKNSPHILITTPESLALMLSSPKFKEHLKNVDWFILDEIHSLAENKRGVHLSLSMERLQRLSEGMTRVGLSATVAPLEEVAKFLVGNRKCKIINVQFIKNFDVKVLSPVKDLINIDYETLSKKMYELIDNLIQEHKTTLIFTNTRSGTERVVHHLKSKFPKKYMELDEGPPPIMKSLIGAHHGSLSKEHRFRIEDMLRKGELKAIVSSTSLELGIDIGYIDLVICLGSPKSIARFMQRAGRSGHKLHEKVKARIIVLDRDDLIECSVMLKNVLESKIDKIHIPKNALDVLAQQIFGMVLEDIWDESEMFDLIRKSYCYNDLKRQDFEQVLSYLSGEFSTLEDRNVYAKIWRIDGRVGKRGRLARVIYMTNIGTIPDETSVIVKINEQKVGTIDEAFLEKLNSGDIFVLGGETYKFKYAKGMVAQVIAAPGKMPTIPSWFSEMLPLSFDLALEIQRFRRLMEQRLKKGKKETIDFVNEYLYVDDNAAEAIYNYFNEQYNFMVIPHLNRILLELYIDEKGKKYNIFHTLYGRRVNDVLSRAIAYAISRTQHKDVEIGINDNGFYITSDEKIDMFGAFKLLKSEELRKVLELALERSEVLKRRFRHCASRALMILRRYKGRTKRVGRQQVGSMILMSAVRRISNDFFILKETRREVLEDLMDIDNSIKILNLIEKGEIKIEERFTYIPSPFAFNLVLQGYSDILKVDDKQEFLKRMHNLVLAKLGKDGKL